MVAVTGLLTLQQAEALFWALNLYAHEVAHRETYPPGRSPFWDEELDATREALYAAFKEEYRKTHDHDPIFW